MNTEREYLKDIAGEIAELSADPIQQERLKLVKACNDLKPIRPVVFARPENGWPDLHEKWGPMRCNDPKHVDIEDALLKTLIRAEHIRDDMPIMAEYRVPTRMSGNTYGDFGLDLQVTQLDADGSSDTSQNAYHVDAVLTSWDDMAKLHHRNFQTDRSGSLEDLEYAQELLGDVLDVWQPGVTNWRYGHTRILIHMRGFQQYLFDLYDSPAQLHELMEFLSGSFRHEIETCRDEGLITPNSMANDYIGVGGPCATDDLPNRGDKDVYDTSDCVVWAEAQETVGVSTEQFEEFVFKYQKPLVDQFGLCGYGCCEGLDRRFDILKEGLPNLRWVAVSPWADADKMAEQIGSDYVYLYKVNPALVVAPDPDWPAAKAEMKHIRDITEGMSVQYSLKDTNTFCKEPERIRRWVDMAMEISGA